MKTYKSSTSLLVSAAAVYLITAQIGIASATIAVDPGVRSGDAGTGLPVAGLSPNLLEYFNAGGVDFAEAENVPSTTQAT